MVQAVPQFLGLVTAEHLASHVEALSNRIEVLAVLTPYFIVSLVFACAGAAYGAMRSWSV